MAEAIAITTRNHTAADLRCLTAREKDGDVVRRLSAMALVLEDSWRTKAAALNGMQRQHLCDWVHRYNGEGVVGLKSRATELGTGNLDDALSGTSA